MNVVTAILAASQEDRPIVWRKADGGEDVYGRHGVIDAAHRRAAGLHARGIRPGQVVGLVLPQGIELIQTWLGCLILGAIPTILPPPGIRQPRELWHQNLRHVVTYAGARALVHAPDLPQELSSFDEPLPDSASFISVDQLLTTDAQLDPPPTHPDQVILLQHSSGTTGLQKGVTLTHRTILEQISRYQQAIALDPGRDSIVSWLPLYHDMGLVACLLLPMITGTKLVFMDNFCWALNPSMLLEAISLHRATLCWMPNFAFNFLASRISETQKEPLTLASVRMWVNCSEPVRRASMDRFIVAFQDQGVSGTSLAACYAMAENTFAVTQTIPGTQPAEGPAADLVSCGIPLQDHSVRIINEDGQVCREQELGSIQIHSPCLMDGYYRDEQRSAEVLRDGWYETGDLGLMREGELYVYGRKKDLIILAGKNVFPEDVEQAADSVEGVAAGRTAALGIYDEGEGTEMLILLAEYARDLDPTPAQLRQMQRAIKKQISSRLGLLAHRVLMLAPRTLLKSSAGKISRSRCRTLYVEQLQPEDESQNPR